MEYEKGIGILPTYDTQEEEPVSYCSHCLEHGLYELLGPRILKPNEPVPEDYDQWRSCYGCGRIIPIYEQKFESEIKDVVESVENPPDTGQKILGNENKKPKDNYQRERQRLLDRIDKQKDPEIRAALKRGLDVQIIEDSMK